MQKQQQQKTDSRDNGTCATVAIHEDAEPKKKAASLQAADNDQKKVCC
jgi:hypothetical protein